MASRRILILTNRIPYPLNDGGNLAMNAMIEGYRREGWEVCLLSMNTSRHYIAPDVLANIYTGIRFEAVAVNNDVKPLPTILNFLFSSQPNHAVRFDNAAFRQKLQQLLREFDPHVVQLESVFLSGYLPVIRQYSTALTVLRLHNIEWQVWQRLAEETGEFFKRFYLGDLARRIRQYEEKVWKEYDLLLPITEVDAAVARQYNEHTVTVPFGIDTAGVKEQVWPADWKSYHIGAMDWLPNAEAINWFLKEVWPAIHRQHPGLVFHYAGRNMPESFKRLGIPGAVCAGGVPDAAGFMADKNILIVPLRSGGGIRIKILEAMAAGKLVISTDTGMQGIDAVAGKHYLRANSPQDFLAAVDHAYTHKEIVRQVASNAALLAKKHYDRHNIMQQLVVHVDNMLKKNAM